MANESIPALGVSQLNEVETKPVIRIGSEEWKLKRDAMDSTSMFPHERVNWILSGCNKVFNQPFYVCWIKGVILPAPNSLEQAQYVFYIGFHSKQISMSPAHLTVEDLKRMHIYTRAEHHFAEEFTNSFLGIEAADDVEREAISPQPPKSTKAKKSEVKEDEQS
ncbi:hypothetical protein vBYenSP400_41 [Yersinia phage vB_YenS_P400]|nr:hypothetical protein vBYenSP400_41 [Yersinia phage vB_YenS_P400]